MTNQVPLESFSEQLITYFLFGKYSSPDKANKHEMKENFRSRFTVVAFPTHFLSLSGLWYIVLSHCYLGHLISLFSPQLHREKKNFVIVPILLFLYHDMLFEKVGGVLLLFYLAKGIYL